MNPRHVRYLDWQQVTMSQLANEEKLILIAGSVCKDWSTMGKQKGFNGNFTMLCAVMLAICRRVRPLVFIHECTRLFPFHILEKALKGSTDHHLILDPPNHGAPVRRSRSYDAVIKQGWDIRLGRDHAMADFARLLNKCTLDAGVWLQAPQNEAAGCAWDFQCHCFFIHTWSRLEDWRLRRLDIDIEIHIMYYIVVAQLSGRLLTQSLESNNTHYIYCSHCRFFAGGFVPVPLGISGYAGLENRFPWASTTNSTHESPDGRELEVGARTDPAEWDGNESGSMPKLSGSHWNLHALHPGFHFSYVTSLALGACGSCCLQQRHLNKFAIIRLSLSCWEPFWGHWVESLSHRVIACGLWKKLVITSQDIIRIISHQSDQTWPDGQNLSRLSSGGHWRQTDHLSLRSATQTLKP